MFSLNLINFNFNSLWFGKLNYRLKISNMADLGSLIWLVADICAHVGTSLAIFALVAAQSSVRTKHSSNRVNMERIHPITCSICGTGRYCVPPCYKCEMHGLMCSGCSSILEGCPLCIAKPVEDDKAEANFDWHIALVCVDSPECGIAMPGFWYDEHYDECSLNQTNNVTSTAALVHIPPTPGQIRLWRDHAKSKDSRVNKL